MKANNNIHTIEEFKVIGNNGETTPEQNQVTESLMAQLTNDHHNRTHTNTTTSSFNNHNGSDSESTIIPNNETVPTTPAPTSTPTSTPMSEEEVRKVKIEYLQRKEEMSRNQVNDNFRHSRRNTNNIQEVTDTVLPEQTTALPQSEIGDSLREAARQTRAYARGMDGIANEQARVAQEMTTINERLTNVWRASRRLSLEYVQFMYTQPFVGIMTTGAVFGIGIIIFRSGVLGNVRRAITSSFREMPLNPNNNAVINTAAQVVPQPSDLESVIRRLIREGWTQVSVLAHTGGGLYFLRIVFAGLRRGRR